MRKFHIFFISLSYISFFKENLVLGCSPPKQFRIKDADQRVEPYADDDYQVAMGLADEETTDEGEPDDDYEPPPTVRRISQNSQVCINRGKCQECHGNLGSIMMRQQRNGDNQFR